MKWRVRVEFRVDYRKDKIQGIIVDKILCSDRVDKKASYTEYVIVAEDGEVFTVLPSDIIRVVRDPKDQ